MRNLYAEYVVDEYLYDKNLFKDDPEFMNHVKRTMTSKLVDHLKPEFIVKRRVNELHGPQIVYTAHMQIPDNFCVDSKTIEYKEEDVIKLIDAGDMVYFDSIFVEHGERISVSGMFEVINKYGVLITRMADDMGIVRHAYIRSNHTIEEANRKELHKGIKAVYKKTIDGNFVKIWERNIL